MQKIRYSRYFKITFILLDVLVITGVFLFFFIRNNEARYDQDIWEQNLLSIILLTLFWILLSGFHLMVNCPSFVHDIVVGQGAVLVVFGPSQWCANRQNAHKHQFPKTIPSGKSHDGLT